VIAGSIARWFADPSHRDTIERLRAARVDFANVPSTWREPTVAQVLAGKAVVVTGTVPGYSRDGAIAAIKERGGTSPGSVSAKTFALVVGEEPGASKLTKAETLGVPIVDSSGFEQLLATGEITSR
jgi:DNA ligase (NAD+)